MLFMESMSVPKAEKGDRWEDMASGSRREEKCNGHVMRRLQTKTKASEK